MEKFKEQLISFYKKPESLIRRIIRRRYYLKGRKFPSDRAIKILCGPFKLHRKEGGKNKFGFYTNSFKFALATSV